MNTITLNAISNETYHFTAPAEDKEGNPVTGLPDLYEAMKLDFGYFPNSCLFSIPLTIGDSEVSGVITREQLAKSGGKINGNIWAKSVQQDSEFRLVQNVILEVEETYKCQTK